MKLKYYFFLLLFITSSIRVNAQNLKGIWLAKYILEIEKGKSDTVFKKSISVLDFVDNQHFISKPIGVDTLFKGEYIIKNDTNIQLKYSKDSIHGMLVNNELRLIISKPEDNSKNVVYFKRITPSTIKRTQIPDSTSFCNSNWNFVSDSKDYNSNFNLHFLDKKRKIIRNIYGMNITRVYDKYGFTQIGDFLIDNYKNHFFMNIYNRETGEGYFYHFYKFENDVFIGETYEGEFFQSEAPPILQTTKLVKGKLLSEKEKKAKKNKLIGNWKSISKSLFDDDNFAKFKKESFQVNFKENGKFNIYFESLYTEKNVEKIQKNNIEGTWRVSNTGDYLHLKTKSNYVKFLTLKKVSYNKLTIFYNVMWREHKEYGFTSRESFFELIKK